MDSLFDQPELSGFIVMCHAQHYCPFVRLRSTIQSDSSMFLCPCAVNHEIPGTHYYLLSGGVKWAGWRLMQLRSTWLLKDPQGSTGSNGLGLSIYFIVISDCSLLIWKTVKWPKAWTRHTEETETANKSNNS